MRKAKIIQNDFLEMKQQLEAEYKLDTIRKNELDNELGLKENMDYQMVSIDNSESRDMCKDDILFYCDYYNLRNRYLEVKTLYSEQNLVISKGKHANFFIQSQKQMKKNSKRIDELKTLESMLDKLTPKYKEIIANTDGETEDLCIEAKSDKLYVIDYVRISETCEFLSNTIENQQQIEKELASMKFSKIRRKFEILVFLLVVIFLYRLI